IDALTAVAGIAAATAAATTTALRARHLVAGDKLLVAGMHHFPFATAAVMKVRFGNIAAGNRNAFAAVQIGDAAFGNGFVHRFLDMLAVAAQKPLPVYGTLVFAIQASINNVGHSAPPSLYKATQ